MEDWSYHELLNAIKDTHQEFVSEGMKPVEAVSRCMGEFENVADQGYCERILVYACGAELYSKVTDIMPVQLHAGYLDTMNRFDMNKARDYLNHEECLDLEMRVANAKNALKSMRVYDLEL